MYLTLTMETTDNFIYQHSTLVSFTHDYNLFISWPCRIQKCPTYNILTPVLVSEGTWERAILCLKWWIMIKCSFRHDAVNSLVGLSMLFDNSWSMKPTAMKFAVNIHRPRRMSSIFLMTNFLLSQEIMEVIHINSSKRITFSILDTLWFSTPAKISIFAQNLTETKLWVCID